MTDALDAYKWSQTKVPELLLNDAGIEVDGSRVVTFGQSCGATLALLMVCKQNRDSECRVHAIRLKLNFPRPRP